VTLDRPDAVSAGPEEVARLRAEVLQHECNERALQVCNQALERLATGAPLGEVLTLLVRAVESADPEILCSVLLLDRATRRLRLGAAPSLSEEYNRAVDNLAIGPGVGSCGTAAFTGQLIIVEDVETHPYWERYRDVARRAGLRACWSQPIVSQADEVLGTFAIYYRQPRRPSAAELDRIQFAAHVAGVAIQGRQAEETLRENIRRHETILQTILDGYLLLDSAGKIIDVNEAYCELSGYRRGELLTMRLPDLLPPDRTWRADEHFARLLSAGRRRFDTQHRRRDGTTLTLEASATAIQLERGRCLVEFVRDVSARKRVEQEILRLNATLEQRVAARTADLSAANDQLQREIRQRQATQQELQTNDRILRNLLDLQDRERQLLAYEIHDGFVQLVVGAQMIVEGLYSELAAASGPAGDDLNHVRQLLRKAIDEGRLVISELRPMILDERGIVDGIQYLVEEGRQSGEMDIDFQAELSCPRLPALLEGNLFRITQEALNNVRRHSQVKSATIRLKQTNGWVQLEITDRGVGFDPRNLSPRRFGLEGIRKRAQLLGGRAEIASRPGQGTCVRVDLPVNPPPGDDPPG